MTHDEHGTGRTGAVTVSDLAPVQTEPAENAAPRKVKRPYLYQADLFRVVTFACVIADHVISGCSAPDTVPAKGLEMLLHFTRLAFFALTGFVLVYQYARRPFTATSFWRRRFALVGIPYVVWSVFYWAYALYLGIWHLSIGQALWQLVVELATGNAWYQMYFLLVTMQVYLLFPLIMKLLNATEGYHKWVLAVCAVLQVVFMWLFVHPPVLTGFLADVWGRIYVVVIAYPLFVMLGAVAAWHLDAVSQAVRRFGPWIVTATVVATLLTELDYLRGTHNGIPPMQASNIFLPHMIVFFVLVIAGQYTVSCWWASRRRPDSFASRAVSYGSDRSFAVFLLHPLALQILAPYILPWEAGIGMLWTTAIVYLLVLAMSLAGAEITRRVPGSMWLNGRPMIRTDYAGLVRRAFGKPAASESRG